MSESVMYAPAPPRGGALRNAAKTHCDNGHEFTEANTYRRPNGGRDCRACLRGRRQKHRDGVTALCSYCGVTPVWAKDLCGEHYRMVLLYGVPSTGRLDQENIAERRTVFFWANVDKRGPDECWPWTGPLMKHGYAQMSWFDGSGTPCVGVHRIAYMLAYGEIDPGDPADPTEIDHMCHEPSACKLKFNCPHRRCCNPAHLEAKPRSENTRRSDRSRPGNGGKPGQGGRKCMPGCACGRHRRAVLLPAVTQ